MVARKILAKQIKSRSHLSASEIISNSIKRLLIISISRVLSTSWVLGNLIRWDWHIHLHFVILELTRRPRIISQIVTTCSIHRIVCCDVVCHITRTLHVRTQTTFTAKLLTTLLINCNLPHRRLECLTLDIALCILCIVSLCIWCTLSILIEWYWIFSQLISTIICSHKVNPRQEL